MRPAHVFAEPSPDAELEIVALLHGPWRYTLRVVMIWLSLRGLTASDRRPLRVRLPYDPALDRSLQPGGHRGPRGPAPRRCTAGRSLAWTVRSLWRRLGWPAISLATFARWVREQANWRRPRLVAKGDPEEAAKLAARPRAIAALPEGAVILGEDETHVNLLPWVRPTRIAKGQRREVMTPGQE